MEFRLIVKKNNNAKRAVDALVNEFNISSQMQKRIRLYGNLWINGKLARMIDPVYTGDLIVAHPVKDATLLTPAKINSIPGVEILFEDDHLIVVNKPSNLVVHPTMSHPDNTLLDLLSEQKLHSVTRLDRETTGALIIAKHPHAHYRIVQNPIKRIYWAFTHGHWPKDQASLVHPIKRDPDSIMLRIVDQKGRAAITHYSVVKSYSAENFDWVEFELETGRTHQIRVHSLFSARPLLADGLYGIADYCTFDADSNFRIINHLFSSNRINPEFQKDFANLLTKEQLTLDKKIKRQALHSRLIGFVHPITQQYLEFEAEMPSDMEQIISVSD